MSVRFIFYSKVKTSSDSGSDKWKSLHEKKPFQLNMPPKIVALLFHTTETSVTSNTTFF